MDVFFTLFQISFSFFLDALMKVRLPLPLLAALAARLFGKKWSIMA